MTCGTPHRWLAPSGTYSAPARKAVSCAAVTLSPPEPSLEPVSSMETKSPTTANAATRAQERQLGFRVIVAYKFIKAAIMLAVAIWLTVKPASAYHVVERVARDLADGGAAFGRLGRWIQENLSTTFMVRGTMLAWLDSLTSAIEGTLLVSGKPWAHWIVIIGLAALLPFEILSIEHRAGIGKFLVLGANVIIVVYLARGEIRKAQHRR